MDAKSLEQVVLAELKEHFKIFLMEEEVRKKYDQRRVPIKDNRKLYEKNLELFELTKTTLYEKYKDEMELTSVL